MRVTSRSSPREHLQAPDLPFETPLAVHAKFRLVFPKRHLGEPAGQKRGLQPQRAERRAELVRGDRQKFVAGGHRGPKVRDQAIAVLLRDGAQFTLVLLVRSEARRQQFAMS